jgi:Holliday junction resolvase-like predicted endonuclease
MLITAPGLYPELSENEIVEQAANDSHGEFLCAKALEAISEQKGWHVLRSYNIERHREHHQGEIDLLVVTAKAVVCLEVKSSSVRYDARGYTIHNRGRNSWESTQNPFEQSKNNSYSLLDTLKSLEAIKFPFPVVWGVWFPEMQAFDAGAEYENWRVGLESDLGNSGYFIEELIIQSLKKLQEKKGKSFREIITQKQIVLVNALRRIGEPDVGYYSHDVSRISNKIKANVQLLTENQKRVFEGLHENRKLVVFGGAGTGKTYLAILEILRCLDDGQTVLVLMRSKYLKNLFKAKLKEQEVDQGLYDVFSLSETSWTFVNDHTKIKKPQVLIVDEYQDLFEDAEFSGLLAMFQNGFIRLFGDHVNQSITNPAVEVKNDMLEALDGFSIYSLSVNCRNTKYVIEDVKKVTLLDKTSDYLENTIVGERVKATPIKTISDLSQKVDGLLSSGVLVEEIVIVDLEISSNIKPSILIDGIHFKKFGELGDGVRIAQPEDVKGLEFDYVIVTGLGSLPSPEKLRSIYVAITRAVVSCELVYDLSDGDFSVLQLISKLYND